MAGLGLLILGAILGGSAIKAGIENANMMSTPYRKMDDGTPVYHDRLCNDYINGEKVVSQWVTRPDGSVKILQVGQRSKRVYFDPDEAKKKKVDTMNNEKLQQAKSKGELAYLKYDLVRKEEITCEISTGKFIAYLEGDKDGNYKKYYLQPSQDFIHCHCKPEGVIGVPITREEFDKLNIYMGTHSAYDYSRCTRQYYKHIGSTTIWD